MESIDVQLANELWTEFYAKHGRGWLVVRSGSMAPLIRPGDRVLISPAIAEDICCGDIVVFKRSGSLIVHRVLKKLHKEDGICFVEKGDSSPVWGLFGPHEVISRVTLVESNGKMFDLSSPFSRLTSRVLSAWFYWTSAVITKLISSSYKDVRRLGRVLSRLSLLSSNILVRICCAVCGLFRGCCRYTHYQLL